MDGLWHGQYKVLRAEYEVLGATCDELRTRCAALSTENAQLRFESSELRALNVVLSRDVQDLKADLVMADQVNQALHARLKGLLDAYQSLQAEISGEVVDHSCLEGTCGCPKLDPWVEECEPPLNTFGVRGT